jgi:hypothetical protein
VRNVRPAWCDVFIDGERKKGTGPRARTGTLAVDFQARIAGVAMPVLRVEMIASQDASTVIMRVVDLTSGAVWAERRFAQ